MNQHTEKAVKKLKLINGALGLIIEYYTKTDLEIILAIIQACMLPLLYYKAVHYYQGTTRQTRAKLTKVQHNYRKEYPQKRYGKWWKSWYLRPKHLN
ncbi:hypothetical protein EVAR_40579_1 [Eumeta japonica]|uniref:Uncharacterized protein n=1 Tax=Eumeta variegata TaxID=151549 RepID=A0A4C1VY09_EUMVA|nr:hypothetical protein EVAR_40579_1 [Eumeta japonica]